jgi:hypothetical protein
LALLLPGPAVAADPVALGGARSDEARVAGSGSAATGFDGILEAAVSGLEAAAAADDDGDGVPAGVEAALGLDPTRRDTDGDGTQDGDEDPDGDRLTTRFEIERSHTDPGSADSDLDGIRDGAEDPDGDRLSNAGEQRFGTDPLRKDTDGDGRSDWREDADRDGRANGLEQDAARLPRTLTPSLRRAAKDIPPAGDAQCHSRRGLTKPGSCASGPRDGKVVLLIGDSHAVHWFPAIERVAEERGWRLITMTKSACPIADVMSIRDGSRDRACATWRKRAFEKARRLKPALVIVANIRIAEFVGGGWPSRDARTSRLWRDALTRSYRRLRDISTTHTVVVLGDIQKWSSDLQACLKRHPRDIRRCSPRAGTEATLHWEQVTRKAAKAAHVGFQSTWRLACPYDPCPIVIDGTFLSRDGDHLTATYAAQLWRGIAQRLPDP